MLTAEPIHGGESGEVIDATPATNDPALLAQLEECEQRMTSAWVEVAFAIDEIHRGKLYRARGYDTFEDYSKERWGLSRATAYRYVEAAQTLNRAAEKGLVSHPRDIRPHMSQRTVLALGRAMKDDEAHARWLANQSRLPEEHEVNAHARALLDDPALAVKHNAPDKPPARPPNVNRIHGQITRLIEAIRIDGALDARGEPMNPTLIEDARELANLIAAKLNPQRAPEPPTAPDATEGPAIPDL